MEANETIKKGILNCSSNEINVVASCKYYKQAESIKKELKELNFELKKVRQLQKLFQISGTYRSSDPEDIKIKLEKVKSKGWEFI